MSLPRMIACAALVAASMLAAAAAWAQEPTVVVANRVIYPGQKVPMAALQVVPLRRDLADPSAYLMTPESVAGKVALRTLLPGRMIPAGWLREAHLVEAGQPVELRFVDGALVISTTGVPLQSGAAGELVKVRNMDSGVVISGVVMADGTVQVGAS